MAVKDDHHQQPKRIEASQSSSQSVLTLLTEIIVGILSRLPVDSLLRCRSVCKLWCSIISDPYFVKSHLSMSASNTSYAHHRIFFSTQVDYLHYLQHVIKGPRIKLKTCNLYDVLYDNFISDLNSCCPLKPFRESVFIVGSCNGLICLANEEDALFLWNPSTRKLGELPFCGKKRSVGLFRIFGFGYYESTDDYKVVEVSCNVKDRTRYETFVRIYSLKNGNWKKIGAFPHAFPILDYGKFCNGALHWAASKDFGSSYWSTIVSLELANETYGEVLQPVYDEGDKNLTLGSLSEWLCVLCDYRGSHVDFWVMKVYGVKDSWTKLVSIPYLTDPGRDQFSVPLCISNDWKILLQFGSKLIVFDSKNGSSSEIKNVDECLEACTFVESLVSPDAPSRPWR